MNQTRQLVWYAVPTPSFALDVQRGSIPGAPNAIELSGELMPKRLDDSNLKGKIVAAGMDIEASVSNA